MDKNIFESNLNTLREMILDEQKFVTYVSLSKDLCIHVNESKFLLSQIVENIRKNKPDIMLNVSFLISGLYENNKARMIVCSEEEVPMNRKAFKVLFFEHIYGVTQGLPSVDNVTFLANNNFEDLLLCTGLIKSNVCLKRTSDEIGSLKSNSQELTITEQKPVNEAKKKTNIVNKEVRKNETDGVKNIVEVHEIKSEPNIKSEIPSAKKDCMSTNNKNKFDKKNNHKAQKGIAGFLTKSNNINKKMTFKNDKECETEVEQNKDTKESINVKYEKMDVDRDTESVESEIESVESEIENKNKSKSSKSINLVKKDAKVDKNRKRLLHVSDSESDEEDNNPCANHESEDEIPPTPSFNTIKIKSGIVNPKKRRKLIDKTYTDEDGYILTKKEEVYESCSENEEEINTKENVKNMTDVKSQISPKQQNGTKNGKKKISPPQKGKQTTLMNFFKMK